MIYFELKRRHWHLTQALILLVCFIISLFSFHPVLAQPPHFTNNPVWWSNISFDTWEMAIGDINGDGYLDLVCGNEQYVTLYMNTGGSLSTTPAWSSEPGFRTRGVALGDIDGDGDLDLLCGNFIHSNTLYLNTGGTFSSTPDWASEKTYATASAILGDIDADGDLDLVCGNDGDSNTVYLNEGGTFPVTPAWSSDQMNKTIDVALADVDGNGYLDLVCANDGQNTLYLNTNGSFPHIPSWTSEPTDVSLDVVLGDVDGDGDLDIIFGNQEGNNTLYRNEGGSFPVTPELISESGWERGGIDLGDIDGDGDLDLVCGMRGDRNAIYLNEDGTFSETPAWSSGQINSTESVAFGDIDGDGDLDLLCGNFIQSNTLYRNLCGAFSTMSMWSPERTDATRSVTLGYIDDDEYLDVVFGNYAENSTLYLNINGSFSTVPDWESGPSRTVGVAMGDVDGDGDLDLVCANYNESDALYLNQGGTFSSIPDWETDSAYNTMGLALGDIDGDGDLDLVCGHFNESNAFYINEGGSFVSDPTSMLGPPFNTECAILGDVDGDGDLDFVCGSYGNKNTFYINEAGTLSASPAWYSGPRNLSLDVAVGDVDGDGDADIVYGNKALSNTIYPNELGLFSATPEWIGGPDNTRSVILEDVDGDGSLDLTCGNRDGQNTLLLNYNGMFSTTPAWASDSAYTTRGAAMGDVDGDGDFDLVCGNAAQTNTFYEGIKTPTIKGDPLTPTHYQPYSSAYVQFVKANQIDVNLYQIRFTAVDIESDPVWILLEYQHRGEPMWHPVEISGQTGKIGPFPSSPEGIDGSFDWDTSSLPFDNRDIVLRLKVISTPMRVSKIQHVVSFLYRLDAISPVRPEITTSDDILSFSTVTIGDTISTDFIISNSGSAELIVADIILPSTEMKLPHATPCSLQVGERDTLTISLEPREELSISGGVQIVCNDPLSPIVLLQVEADIRALDFKTKLLSQADTIPLGEAVTVEVTPEPGVHIEGGYLYYRPASSHGGAFTDSIPLTLSVDEFAAVIPGAAITELGLDYCIKVENSGLYAYDPPGAPYDSFFYQPVHSPSVVSSSPKPNSSLGYLEGRPIRIEVTLPQGTVFASGWLGYRLGGRSNYTSMQLEYEDPFYVATIPGDFVKDRGVEYNVNVTTSTRTLWDPPGNPLESPHSIAITVQNLVESSSHPADEYRMISIPLRFAEDFTGTLDALLSDQAEFGPYDPTVWRSFRIVPVLSKYVELSETSAEEYFRPAPGKAFWLISKHEHRIGTAPITGYSTPTDNAYEIVIEPGWNMIGNPFNFPLGWDSVMVDSFTMDMNEALNLVSTLYHWEPRQYYNPDAAILFPFDGYWIKNISDSNLTLRIPPKAYHVLDHMDLAGTSSDRLTSTVAGSWLIKIEASCSETSDLHNYAGSFDGAGNQWDIYDEFEPPPVPGHSVSLYFPHGTWEKHPDRYTSDIRGSYEPLNHGYFEFVSTNEELWGHLWHFDVAKSFSDDAGGDEVTLDFSGVESVPAGAVVLLIDRHLSKQIDLRTESTYRFFLGQRGFVSKEDDARFVLLVGSEEFVGEHEDELPKPPTATALHQNYPNPFNPSTIIRYDIAAPGTVELKIYDARGTLVKTLLQEHRDPGRYEIGWDGTNNTGLRVASGIYFYRLRTGTGFTKTRKIILLR